VPEVDEQYGWDEAARIMRELSFSLPGTVLESWARSWLHLFEYKLTPAVASVSQAETEQE
jgi:hypothetical protein